MQNLDVEIERVNAPLKWKIKKESDDNQHNDNQQNDNQHNDNQHNDNQHKWLICDTQHKWHSAYKTHLSQVQYIFIFIQGQVYIHIWVDRMPH